MHLTLIFDLLPKFYWCHQWMNVHILSELTDLTKTFFYSFLMFLLVTVVVKFEHLTINLIMSCSDFYMHLNTKLYTSTYYWVHHFRLKLCVKRLLGCTKKPKSSICLCRPRGVVWGWWVKRVGPFIGDPWCTAAEGASCWGESLSVRGGVGQSHGGPTQTQVSYNSSFLLHFLIKSWEKNK